jgi:putative exporter of polyketide antibiotics
VNTPLVIAATVAAVAVAALQGPVPSPRGVGHTPPCRVPP